MQFIKNKIDIDFAANKTIAISLSIILILCGIISLLLKGGPKLGIDFTGGTLLQVKFNNKIDIQDIREILRTIGMGDGDIQEFGSNTEVLIKMERSSSKLEDIGSKVKEAFDKAFPKQNVRMERVEAVGPKVGGDLRQKALFALYYAILFIVVYISGRFEFKWTSSIILAGCLILCMQILLSLFPGLSITILIFAALAVTIGFCIWLNLKYALAAIIALIHDVLITVGAFSITNKEFTLPVIAALLTIIGYSLNDTIVIFDRIRENKRSYKKSSMAEVINSSINQSLSRTLLTSLTTLLMVAALFILGGEVIHDFSFALLVGVIVGTYSSIFIASPILLAWKR